MGHYTNNLSRRLRGNRAAIAAASPDGERLESAAIWREGKTHSGHRSHYQLRASLGDDSPHVSNPNDVEGFMTNKNRFVSRQEAQDIAVASGQLQAPQGRPLLSSDINW